MNHFVRVSAFSCGIIAVVCLIAVLMPSAQIFLFPRLTTQTLEVDLKPSLQAPSITLDGVVPAQKVVAFVQSSATAQSHGSVYVPSKRATGKVLFRNLTNTVLSVPQGTVVASTREPTMRFRVTNGIIIKGEVNETVEAEIEALTPGKKGNAAAAEIQVIEGSLGDKVAVTNVSAVTGGEDLLLPAPSDEDWNQLHVQVRSQLVQAALEELYRRAAENFLIRETARIDFVEEEEALPAMGLPSETLYLTLRAEVSVWAVEADDVRLLAQQILDAGLPGEQTGLYDTLVVQPAGYLKVDDQPFSWRVTFTRQAVAVKDLKPIKNITAGKNKQEAAAKLRSILDQRQDAQILLSPAWWPNLPYLKFRINVEYE